MRCRVEEQAAINTRSALRTCFGPTLAVRAVVPIRAPAVHAFGADHDGRDVGTVSAADDDSAGSARNRAQSDHRGRRPPTLPAWSAGWSRISVSASSRANPSETVWRPRHRAEPPPAGVSRIPAPPRTCSRLATAGSDDRTGSSGICHMAITAPMPSSRTLTVVALVAGRCGCGADQRIAGAGERQALV